jgi:hypothetical protein
MSFTPLLAVGTLVFTLVNFLTYWRGKNYSAMLTQVIAWAAGIGAILIAAHTQFAPQISFSGQTLAKMDWQTQVFIGLIATSILSTVNEVKKAIDTSDSAKKTPLFPSLTKPSGKASALGSPQGEVGTVDLTGGSVVVAHPGVTTETRILVTPQSDAINGNLRVTITRSGSFTISSTAPGDEGAVAYQILD